MRKYLRILFLVIFSQYLHINANAQIDAPKWVDDIGGPSSNCISSGVGVDKQNNIFIAGFFSGTADFDPSAGGTHNLTAKGDYDGFVAKYTTDGKLIWAVSMGGSSTTQVNSMIVDANGNPIISGQFNSSDLDADPGSGTTTLSTQGGYDAFVIKLDSNGALVWAKSIGGGATDYGSHIIADSQGNVIEDVLYQSTVKVASQSFTAQGSQFNGLAIKFDPSGNLIWAINIGDPGNSEVNYSTVDHQDNVLLCGSFQGNDNFDPLGTPSYINGNGGGTYIAKYTSAGSLIWVKSFNGPSANICVNSKNDIFLDGPFSSTISFNGTSLSPVGAQDLYLAKYSSAGDFEFAKDVGGANGSMYNYGIQSSQDDYIFISGYFSGTIDFDPSPATSALISDHGQRDFFLTKYDSDLNYKWAFNGGSPDCNNSLGRAIIADNNNDILFTGGFCSTVNFSASTCTPYPLTAQSSTRDCFLGKYTQNTATAAAQITGFSIPQQSAPAVIDQTNLKITVTVPQGTNITALTPTITYSSGVTLNPASGTTKDFSSGVTYSLSGSCASLNYAVNVVVAAASTQTSNPQVCATPGNDGPTNISGSVNTYFPGQPNLTLQAGANTIALAAVPATDAYGNSFGTTPIAAGDLLLIMQMQDATISYTNDVYYGSNNASAGPDGAGATGFTDIGNSGRFEYVVATNNVPLTGGTLTFTGSGTAGGTVYNYVNADATTTRGKRSFQIIRLPQYSNLRLSSNISPPPFNGVAGGIIAFSVAGNMDFNGFTIDVSGRGFRGGYSLIKATNVNIGDLYVTTADDYRASGKGEGIAGTPRYMWDGYNEVDNIVEGLPAGSDGRGAPANGGGGGNDVNAGGGGAGNGGFGGNGGWGYLSTIANGGRPGSVDFTGSADATRLIMGGGGGGGHANDALTGVKGGVGGGIVIINAVSISGSGTILANGSDGQPGVYGGHPDGSGGGGAGGTVFVQVSNPDPTAVLTINAIGGKGGNTENDDPATDNVQPHGPGGGGGGGLIFYAIASGTVNVNTAGGASGKTNSGAGITHNATDGLAGVSTPFTIASLPANLQGNGGACYPELVTTMNAVGSATARFPNDMVTYTITINNNSTGGSAGGVEANISFPSVISYVSASATYTGAANGPSVLTNNGTSNLPSLGDFNIPFGDAVTITVIAKIDCGALGEYNSSAQAVYLDPTRTYTQPNRRITAATNAFAGANTTYQTNVSGPVPGSNFDGTASSAEDIIVSTVPSGNNTITAPAIASFCNSGTPASIIGSTPTGTYTYQWQSSPDGVNFVNIAGATAMNYTPPALTATTYYLRIVASGVCATPSNSNIISINIVSPPATPVPTVATETICAGTPAALSVSNPQTGVNYNWYDSPAKTNLLFIGPTYVTAAVNANTTYYIEGENTACSSPAMATVQVNVTPAPAAPVIVNNGNLQACYGTQITLNIANPVAGFAYNWRYGTTIIFTGNSYTTPVLEGNQASYFVQAVNGAGCASPSTTVNVMINDVPEAPTVTAQGGSTVCSASAATLTASSTDPNVSFNWYTVATGGTPVFTGATYITPVITATTTYYAEAVSNTLGCASFTRTPVQITVTQPPATPVPTAATVSTCIGSPATLSVANPQTGINYNWYDSAAKTNLLFSGSSYTTGPLSVNTTFYVDAENGTCISPAVASVQVNILPLPLGPTMFYQNQTCLGSPATIIVEQPLDGYTYNWYTTPTGGTPIYTGSSYTVENVTADATFYTDAENASGCISGGRTVTKITVVSAPTAPQVQTPLAICPGSSTTVSIISPQTGFTYNWYDAASGGTPLFTGTTFNAPALTATTSYYVETANSGTCVSSRTAVQITVNQPPATPVPTAAAVSACTGSPATLSVANPQAGINYNWYDSAAKTNLLFTGASYTTGAITANTTFYVDAENGSCASPSVASVQVNITLPPSAPVVINNNPTICSGSAITLSISNPQTGFSYNWYTVATGGTPAFTATTSITIDNFTTSTSYFVEAVNANGCISPTRTETDITVVPLPSAPQVPSTVSVCTGSAATIGIISPQTGLNYNWYNVATGGTPLFTGTIFTTPALNSATSYYAEAVSSTGGCISATRTLVQITTGPPPPVPLPTQETVSICTGTSTTLSVSNPQTDIYYSWFDASKTRLLYIGPSYVTGVLTTNTTYYVGAGNGSCSNSSLAMVQVNVTPAPTPPAIYNSIVQACSGTQATLTIIDPQAGFTYNWYADASGGTSLYTGTNFLTPVLTSSTIYYADAANATGCTSSARSQVSVTVLPAPSTPQISAKGTSICPGTGTTITATSDAGTAIQWFASATGGTIITTGNNFATPVLNSNTTYYAQAVNSNSCTSVLRAAVTITMLQQLDAPVVSVETATPESITFEWGDVTGATGYQVSTDNGNTFTDPSSGSDGLSDEVTGLQIGQQVTIIVRAVGSSSCQLSGSSSAVTGTASYPQNNIIYVANTFTPNGDGKNDVVYVHSNSIKSMNFYVYDQWGELLFKSSSLLAGWDGTFKGTREPVGVYVYFVQATMNDGSHLTKKGTITLLR